MSSNVRARFTRTFALRPPRALLWLLAPTALSIAIDLCLRGGAMLDFQPHGKAIYFSALLVSASLWELPLLVVARAMATSPRTRASRLTVAGIAAAWVFPLAAGGYGGQLVYYRFFRSYAGRDTLRLGALVHGSLAAWTSAWATPRDLAVVVASGVLLTAALLAIARRASAGLAGRWPVLPLVVFPAALGVVWADQVDSRYLQAATPDVCFAHSVLHALRAATTGAGRVRQGVSLRTPAPLPPLASRRANRPSVLLVVTESVRADAMCSDPPPGCTAPFLDAVASDRAPLGVLTSQTPNTFSASLVLLTGLSLDADIVDAHRAATLWEVARAVGYRTAYITSQNAKYEDLGDFVRRAGIDELVTATELGGMAHEQLGAPDERAVDRALGFARAVPAGTPYFVVLQLSNTHHPYRTDPALSPYQPDSDDPARLGAYRNRFRNSVRWQESLVASLVRELRAMPAWDDTVMLFLSDHGEPLGQHRFIHHNHTLFDEELRIPGWLVAGGRALPASDLDALRTYAGVRTFTEDVNATCLDLLGVLDERPSFPLGDRLRGRSLLRPRDPAADPRALLATSTGVWEPNDPWFGVMHRDQVLVGSPTQPWRCYDLGADPAEKNALDASKCGDLEEAGRQAFGGQVK